MFNPTTRKIAEAAGVSVATLHYHVRDKNKLLFSLMESLVRTCRATLADQFPPIQTPAQRIAAIAAPC